jgi:hypothetical protein
LVPQISSEQNNPWSLLEDPPNDKEGNLVAAELRDREHSNLFDSLRLVSVIETTVWNVFPLEIKFRTVSH